MFGLFSNKKKKEDQDNQNGGAGGNNTNSAGGGGSNSNIPSSPSGSKEFPSFEISPLNEIQILSSHTQPIKTLLNIDHERLASAGDDNVILVWSISTGRLLMRLEEHTQRVTCLLSFGNILVSGSMDKKIKMWDLSKPAIYNQETKSFHLESSKTLDKHQKSLKFLEKIPNGFCSASNDENLIIWDEQGEFKRYIVRIQREYITSILCVNNFIIVSGSTAPFLIAYKYDSQNETPKTLGKEITHKDCVNCLMNLSARNFITGSKDNSIIIWDSYTLQPLHQRYCKSSISYLYPIKNFILVTIFKGFSIFDMNGNSILEYYPSDGSLTTELNGAITLYDNTKIVTWADTRISMWSWPYELLGGKKTKYPLRPTLIGDLKGHTDYINSLTILDDNSIATGSSDCNIVLWKDGRIQSMNRNSISNRMYNEMNSRYNPLYDFDSIYYEDDRIEYEETMSSFEC
ncbi:hypothetical protein CYY_006155 [Polysphondylium violaceum]|uniref:WD40 repeat-containing protein n=1 Tax=Polysphondylium violaceum TaxID=133409 RepID=A0A8J4UZ64_9MYCE|nr:hypothetical protein CYY_006155 [Polysphondylium violaceum]